MEDRTPEVRPKITIEDAHMYRSQILDQRRILKFIGAIECLVDNRAACRLQQIGANWHKCTMRLTTTNTENMEACLAEVDSTEQQSVSSRFFGQRCHCH